MIPAMNIVGSNVVSSMLENAKRFRRSGWFQRAICGRFICVAWMVLAMQAGMASAADVESAAQPKDHLQSVAYSVVTPLSSYQRAQFQLAAVEPDIEAVDKEKMKEIMGFQDDDRKTRQFIEYVMLPLGLCLILIMVLRGAFVK